MPPKGPWQLRHLVAVAAFCAAHASLSAQTDSTPEAQAVRAARCADARAACAGRARASRAVGARAARGAGRRFAGGGARGRRATPPLPATPTFKRWSRPSSAIRRSSPSSAPTAVEFDLSPRALVALKSAGVSEPVIEAMIAAEASGKRTAPPEPTSAELAETQASVEYARLTQMIERVGRAAGSGREGASRARAAGVARRSRAARVADSRRPTARRSRRRSRKSRSRAAAAGAASA